MELNPILNLDIGGQKFRVLRETVLKYPKSLLAQVITGKDIYHMLILENCYFFDRNPLYFSVILDYMRIGKIFLPGSLVKAQLDEELKFWKLDLSSPASVSNPNSTEIEPTLVIPELIESTLIIPDQFEPTLIMNTLIEPTVLISSPQVQPTLIVQDPPLYSIHSEKETKDDELKNSIKSLRAEAQKEAKKEVKKIIEEDDELLQSLIPGNNSSQSNRTLPWANKGNAKAKAEKEKIEAKVSKAVEEKKNQIIKNQKNLEKNEEIELGYESSFIDDDDLSINSQEFKPAKRKASAKPDPVKNIKKAASNKCKKATIPDAKDLTNALKNIR